MADDRDGKGEENGQAPESEGAFLQFSLKDGQVLMTTNIPDHLSRYGLWMAGLESMFRANTFTALRAEAAKAQIITPGMKERLSLGLLK